MITSQQHIIPNCHCTASCGNPQGTNATSETYRRAGARGAKDNSESGRSMVEMLGVLAIIGVLTVGGVAGYNFAMTRYRANEIIESVKQRATVGSGQYLQGMEAINLSEFPSTILEYETEGFDEGLNGEKDLFSIDVKEVPQAVCQDILDRNWTWPAGIFVNERDIPCPEGNSKMTFVFAADLNERTGATAYNPCLGKTCCRVTDPNTLAFEEGQDLSNKECKKTAANNLTCCTTANTRQCYFDQASIDRYGPHQNTIADCTNDGRHRCDDNLNCGCTTGCTNPDKVQDPNTCACACPTGVPNADDSACVECLADTDCTGGKVCNMADTTCKCPETGTAPTNTCYTTTAHAATEACPAYTTYEPLTCTEPKTVCDVANNTCKCPACPAAGMTQNADTCECTCPGGKRFNTATKKCETDCATAAIPTIPAGSDVLGVKIDNGRKYTEGKWVAELGPFECPYVVSGCLWHTTNEVVYYIDDVAVYSMMARHVDEGCYSDTCAAAGNRCWSAELPAGSQLRVKLWKGKKNWYAQFKGSLYLNRP